MLRPQCQVEGYISLFFAEQPLHYFQLALALRLWKTQRVLVKMAAQSFLEPFVHGCLLSKKA
jgi:hypothetical protein